MRYQNKTPKFEAVQFLERDLASITQFAGGLFQVRGTGKQMVGEMTLIQPITVALNDWLCRSEEGLYFVLPNAHFNDKYEPYPVDNYILTYMGLVDLLDLDPIEPGKPHKAQEAIDRACADHTILEVLKVAPVNTVVDILTLMGRTRGITGEVLDDVWQMLTSTVLPVRWAAVRLMESQIWRLKEVQELLEFDEDVMLANYVKRMA